MVHGNNRVVTGRASAYAGIMMIGLSTLRTLWRPRNCALLVCLVVIGVAAVVQIEDSIENERTWRWAKAHNMHTFGGAARIEDFVENNCQIVAGSLERTLPPKVVDEIRGKICSPYGLAGFCAYKLKHPDSDIK